MHGPWPGGARRCSPCWAVGLVVGLAQPAYAMHIAEGFLPPMWAGCGSWPRLPFVVLGLRSIARQVQKSPQSKLPLGMSGAYSFVLSSLKIPSVTGSCSHPTGVALGAILFGPTAMTVLGTIVLIFQAILLAHGGLTTLGRQRLLHGRGRALRRLLPVARPAGPGAGWSVFIAATVSDLATYLVTAVQLALAFPAPEGGVVESFVKFTGHLRHHPDSPGDQRGHPDRDRVQPAGPVQPGRSGGAGRARRPSWPPVDDAGRGSRPATAAPVCADTVRLARKHIRDEEGSGHVAVGAERRSWRCWWWRYRRPRCS